MNRVLRFRRFGEAVSDARLERIIDTAAADVTPGEVAAIAGETLARQARGLRLDGQASADRLAAIMDAGGGGVPTPEVANIALELRMRREVGPRLPPVIDPQSSTLH